MNKVKISIIIPVYNTEKYLRQCFESVFRQTFSEYEIICVNDGSTDSSQEIIEMYKERNDFIKNITYKKNYGPSIARNAGLKVATGKYILFLDSDDMILPETLEGLYKCSEQNELDIIYFDMHKIYEKDIEQLRHRREKKNVIMILFLVDKKCFVNLPQRKI